MEFGRSFITNPTSNNIEMRAWNSCVNGERDKRVTVAENQDEVIVDNCSPILKYIYNIPISMLTYFLNSIYIIKGNPKWEL